MTATRNRKSVTVRWLNEQDACVEQVQIVRREWGYGSIPLTLKNLNRAVALGLDLDWVAERVLTAPARAEYKRVMARAWAEYERVRAPAQAEYKRVMARAWAEYERVMAPARAEYKRVMARALFAALKVQP